ncbi:MAG: T9SS type A sorting domain-containing protein [Bacteroidales bacterium]
MRPTFSSIAAMLTLFFFYTDSNQAQEFQRGGNNPGKARLDSSITINYDRGSGEWIIHRKREYRYNETGQMIQSAIDYYDYDENGWLHSRKGEYTWDENGRLVACLYFKKYDWFVQLTPYDKEDLVYDEQGRLAQVYRQKLDGQSWKYYEKEVYEYAEDGSLYRIFQYDMEESGGWYPDELHEFTLDSLGRFQYTTYSEYGGEVYHTRYAMEYGFADNNDLTDLTFHQSVSQSFIPVFKYTYSYDDVNFEDLTIPYLYPFEKMLFNHKIVQADSLGWVSVSQIYLLESREFFYYTGGPSKVVDLIADRNIKVFPNPCDDDCYIEFNDPAVSPVNLSIKDLQGRTVRHFLSVPVNNRIAIPVAGLHPGIYLLRAEYDGQVSMARMVKK